MKTRGQVIISGGMGDIGRASATVLADLGYQIALLHRGGKESQAEAFLTTLSGEGHTAHVCDITDGEEVNRVVGAIGKRGSIAILLHTAVSKLIRKRISGISPQEFKEQFEVTTFGALSLFQAVLPIMKKAKAGRIIALTTAAIEPGFAPTTMSGYVCAKHALRGMLRELHNDVHREGIAVSAIAPDFVKTALHDDLSPRVIEFMEQAQGGKVLATPEDVAQVVLRVCESDPGEVGGKSFLVDSGEATPL